MSNPRVELHILDQGVITLELDADKAPNTTQNFLNYVNKGHYDKTIFHRVIPGLESHGEKWFCRSDPCSRSSKSFAWCWVLCLHRVQA